MKKVLSNSKLSSPSKLVRKVLSRTTVSTSPHEENKSSQQQASTSTPDKNEKRAEVLELELASLREQISILQLAVNNMHEDAEKREKALAHVAREKQQLSIDLRKEKRSTLNLKQQLKDEREFYYKEKEQYCQEMNDCKKLKKKLSKNVDLLKSEEESAELFQFKNRVTKLQEALNQTLETNYNLSVKFMRMKNTKSYLKNMLKQQENDHKEAMQKLQLSVNKLKTDLAEVIDKRFTLPISPSNKKYLQIIKQNGALLHENLCLQMEVDRLTTEVKHYQFKETKRKPKQVHTIPTERSDSNQVSAKDITKDKTNSTKQLKIAQDNPQASSSSNTKKSTTWNDCDSYTNFVTIFERGDIPHSSRTVITQVDTATNTDNSPRRNEDKCNNESCQLPQPVPKEKIQSQGSASCVKSADLIYVSSTRPSSQQVSQTNIKTPSQGSDTCTESSGFVYASSSRTTLRTQSAPEIVQTSSFVSKHKP